MKKEGVQIGKREFAIFKAECRRWMDQLGLKDWNVRYVFEEIDDGLAACRRDNEGRVATLVLNPFQENCRREDVDVRRSAKHEVLHLLLAELDWLNSKRVVTNDVWSAAEHRVIRQLEGALK